MPDWRGLCDWCEGTPKAPKVNGRGEPCPCPCHDDARATLKASGIPEDLHGEAFDILAALNDGSEGAQ